MQAFSRSETQDMMEALGGKLVYTPLSTGLAISGGFAIYNPSTELFEDASADKVVFLLLKETTDNDDITGVPRPVRDDIIVYTDPDDATVITAWVNEVIGSDTHTWRVEARKQ